jgi:hypothetical protein
MTDYAREPDDLGSVRKVSPNEVTTKAVIARINRRFASDESGLKLKVTRGLRMRLEVGNFYVLDMRHNAINQYYKHWHPEDIARELGVLNEHERVVD